LTSRQPEKKPREKEAEEIEFDSAKSIEEKRGQRRENPTWGETFVEFEGRAFGKKPSDVNTFLLGAFPLQGGGGKGKS
jgi:hypothetical protein